MRDGVRVPCRARVYRQNFTSGPAVMTTCHIGMQSRGGAKLVFRSRRRCRDGKSAFPGTGLCGLRAVFFAERQRQRSLFYYEPRARGHARMRAITFLARVRLEASFFADSGRDL